MSNIAADYDVILAGGGLANGLIALALRARRPELRVCLIEAGETLGGNHTWSFHGSDLDPAGHELVAAMVEAQWPRQVLTFPELQRTIDTSYHSMTSDRFHAHIRHTIGDEAILLGQRIDDMGADHVVLTDGRRLTAPCVVDGRGWRPDAARELALAYQKFVGLEVETTLPHGVKDPILMDATVAQDDGYRFVYVLPFDEHRVLIEDTYYSDTSTLDVQRLEARVTAYAAEKEWAIARVVRKEAGVLPIVLAGEIGCLQAGPQDIPRVGLSSGQFHPTTGYSLPDAVRTAQWFATKGDLKSAPIAEELRRRAARIWSERSFFRMLNRLLFVSASGDERRTIMQHFYRLPTDLVERFYAGQPTAFDKIRILTGRPPIPIPRALTALPASSAHTRMPDSGQHRTAIR